MKILGILNVTPDSFSDGSPAGTNTERAVQHGLQLRAEGADIIDIGGESTRPGFIPVGVIIEAARVLPVIRGLVERDPEIRISIDTRKPAVAEQALRAGATIINAYQGLDDFDMASVADDHQCTVIAYHTEDVRNIPEAHAFRSVQRFFVRQEAIACDRGLKPEQLICDPGFGFGKTLSQNVMLLRRLTELSENGRRQMLVGVSRKSHLGTLLKQELGLSETPGVHDRLEAGLAETAFAVEQGVTWVRTHDVRATRNFLAVWDYLRQSEQE